MDLFSQPIQLVDQQLIHCSQQINHPVLKDMVLHAAAGAGKRMRPRLCMMGAYIYNADPTEVVHQSTALELFHGFSLVHDDIMDEAPMRRGEPSVYHAYGRDHAIMCGDAMLILCYEQLLFGLSGRLSEIVLKRFNQVALGVCEGQMLDMAFENVDFPDRQAYMHMIEHKTAILLGVSLEIGALMAGATEREARLLYQYGVLQGLVFQIQDDIIDVYGDSSRTGKRAGGDILRGKKTLLTILCAFKAGEHRAAFEHLFYNQTLSDEEKIRLMKSAYHQFDVLNDVQMIKQNLALQADGLLDALSAPAQRVQALRDFIHMQMDRIQ